MKIFLISFYLTLSFLVSIEAKSQHYIDSSTTYLKGASNIFVSPGDTIYLRAGHKPFLLLENIHGNADSMVVIINYGGKVIINTQNYYGISTQNCTFFKITGEGVNNISYGIDIEKVENGAGIGLSSLSNHFEICNLRIANTLLAGIYAKSDPDTNFSSTRDSFLMEDIYIHHNLLMNIQDEGLYIGNTKYFGQHINYQGHDTLLLPHLLNNVDISFNEIHHTGWDAIQLSSASSNASIHDNKIYDDSYRDYPNQMSGIILGGGTKANCYNNFISGGHGSGILVVSLGGQKIYNNIILNAGKNYFPNNLSMMQYGIYVNDISVEHDSSFYIFNNLIFNPKSDGIRFSSVLSKNNKIANNVIINPGNYWYYDTINTSFKSQDSYIMLTDNTIEIDTFKNIEQLNSASLKFTDTLNHNFTLLSSSPLIDAGSNFGSFSINLDFYHNPRIHGLAVDIGPFEYNSLFQGITDEINIKSLIIYPNPAHEVILIRNLNTTVNDTDINVYGIDGKNIKMLLGKIKHIGNNEISIEITHLKKGYYFIQIDKTNTRFIGKFIVN